MAKRKKRLVQVVLQEDGHLATHDEDYDEPGEFQGPIWRVGRAVMNAVDTDTRIYASLLHRKDPGPCAAKPQGTEPICRYTLLLIVWTLETAMRSEGWS